VKKNYLNFSSKLKSEVEYKRAWPFRYAERFSGTRLLCLLFLAIAKK